MLEVHFHGGGPSGRSDGPVGFDSVRAGVQDDDLVFILDIVVDHPLAVSHGVLGRPPIGIVATTVAVAGSITVASLLLPFIVKICLEAGS